MNISQKSDIIAKLMQRLEGEYRQEDRPSAADRTREARILLMAQPEVAARLYDLLKEA